MTASSRVTSSPSVSVEPSELAATTAARFEAGDRFAGLIGDAEADGSFLLQAVLAGDGGLCTVGTRLPAGEWRYPSVAARVPPAAWYERELHDRYGLRPDGHPRLDPLILPLGADVAPPLSGPDRGQEITPDSRALDAHASGEGMFTIPYGPVRSGVFETVEYLVETFGEDIPRLRSRVYHKHRAIDTRFAGLDLADAVLLAEHVEGTVSVAHATTLCLAVERIAGAEPPRGAELVRLVHAELERIVNHLDTMVRHTEGSYQIAANARLAVHKERLMRLRSKLCGNRFGRGVVVPGGVTGPLGTEPSAVLRELRPLAHALESDNRALMATGSFLDRLRGAGVLPGDVVAEHGALGPLARGSGFGDDTRWSRPYGAYRSLGFEPAATRDEGDALARHGVRLDEISESFRLIFEALEELEAGSGPPWRTPVETAPEGVALSAVEAPQGELLYLVGTEDGRMTRVKPRCGAFHNFALFPQAFRGDILTDFVFIEASFGLSIAGVAG